MTKEAVIAIPSDLSDQVLLRRVLSIIVEELSRLRSEQTEEQTDVNNEQDKLIYALNSKLAAALQEVASTLQVLASATQQLATSRIASAVLSYDGIDYTLSSNVNIAAHNRVGTGIHDFDISQTTVGGVDVLDNVTAAISWSMDNNHHVSYSKVDSDTFRLTISSFATAYDLSVGDSVHVTLFFNPPGAELPEA